ncbi:PIN domain-containing protein [Pseudovibrio sp. FO-BEG1]|uniref:PIN domain-containing protein n=1 Tax=Pseudovibrio sp. (strain FO-BEG1) TaxID=911045 RepID=UPI00059FDBDD|nr:PIN domain-containing protein [Pseudovibrio sp. FO-BEG1]
MSEVKKVFLDANVYISSGKSLDKPIFTVLLNLTKIGAVQLIITDLTEIEVAKKHSQNDFGYLKDANKNAFRAVFKKYLNVEFEKIDMEEMKKRIFSDSMNDFRAGLRKFKPSFVSVNKVEPISVLRDYAFSERFFAGRCKKDQFPDAFIFEALKEKASKEAPIYIVSSDKDFIEPCARDDRFKLVGSPEEFLTKFALEHEEIHLDDFLEDNDDFQNLVSEEIFQYYFHDSEVSDSEIIPLRTGPANAHSLQVYRLAEDTKHIFVIGKTDLEVDAEYSHPDWDGAIYDSEEKCLMPFETITNDTTVEVTADFTMIVEIDNDMKPQKVISLNFPNDDFTDVTLYPIDW